MCFLYPHFPNLFQDWTQQPFSHKPNSQSISSPLSESKCTLRERETARIVKYYAHASAPMFSYTTPGTLASAQWLWK